jgi:hypothetical protein
MEVSGIIVIDMRRRVLQMLEIIKQRVELLSNDTYTYIHTNSNCLIVVLQSLCEP